MLLTMNCPGGKGLSFQNFINLMPPHDVYIESHLGGGSIIRNKRPAKRNIGIEIDADTVEEWRNNKEADLELIHDDAVSYLRKYPFKGNELIYADPPYLRETRRRSRKTYKHEYTVAHHKELLALLKSLPCKVMISGYHSDLYSEILNGWHTQSFQTIIRKHTATEWIWMNYPPPEELHDYRYLGDNFRERARIKKRTRIWKRRLENIPVLERRCLLQAMQGTY